MYDTKILELIIIETIMIHVELGPVSLLITFFHELGPVSLLITLFHELGPVSLLITLFHEAKT